MTTSKAEEDIVRSYHLGVNAYVTKPVTFQALVDVMKVLSMFWFEIVKLPFDHSGALHG
jgi:CheY-like chemotaxis protein